MSILARYLECFADLLDEEPPKAFWIYTESRAAYLAGDLKLAERYKRLNYILHNSEIPYTAEIGKNSVFAYGGIGIILHSNAVIGERCNFGSNVTIGGDYRGVPRIGHDVYLSTGAKILGGIRIGDGVIVGANAVVVDDIEPFSVVAGAPAKVISKITPENFYKYDSYYWCKNSEDKSLIFLDWYLNKNRAKMPGA